MKKYTKETYKKAQQLLVNLESRNDDIVFDEDTHTYIYKNNFLKSVTQLLAEKGISPNYDSVDKDLLAKSSQRGIAIHSLIEKWVKTGEVDTESEYIDYLDQFIDFLQDNEYIVVGSEVRVANDKLGGTIDLILYDTDKEEYIIVDIKTTSVIHTYSVSWQLSLYDKLDSVRDYHKAMVLHFTSNARLESKVVTMQPKEIVDMLVNEEKLPTIAISENKLEELTDAMTLIETYKAKIKENEEIASKINEEIIKAMEENNVKTFENDRVRITYVAPSERETIDSKKLKVELPDIAKKYTKVSTTKASVRITIKESEE